MLKLFYNTAVISSMTPLWYEESQITPTCSKANIAPTPFKATASKRGTTHASYLWERLGQTVTWHLLRSATTTNPQRYLSASLQSERSRPRHDTVITDNKQGALETDIVSLQVVTETALAKLLAVLRVRVPPG